MQVGKRIYLKREMPDLKVVKSFAKLPASNVADCMERSNAMNPRIQLMSNPDQEMCGPAFTAHTRAGDNLAIYAALKYCHPGDVVVINDEGDDTRAVIGEVMMTWLRDQRHVAGVVVDGPMRDIDSLQNWKLPIYATGTTPRMSNSQQNWIRLTNICIGLIKMRISTTLTAIMSLLLEILQVAVSQKNMLPV